MLVLVLVGVELYCFPIPWGCPCLGMAIIVTPTPHHVTVELADADFVGLVFLLALPRDFPPIPPGRSERPAGARSEHGAFNIACKSSVIHVVATLAPGA